MAKINPHVRRPAPRAAARTALLFIISRACALEMFPFGTAFFAACFAAEGGAYTAAAVTAVCAGILSAGAGIRVIKYIIILLIYSLYSRFRRGFAIADAAACGAVSFAGGTVFALCFGGGAYDVLMAAAEAIITSIMYIVFLKAHTLALTRDTRTSVSKDELISAAVCVGVFVTGLSGIRLPMGITLSGIAAAYAVMHISCACSAGAAGGGGLCIGFMSAMPTAAAVSAAGFYGLCAVFSNLLRSFGRFAAAAGFLGGAAAALIYSQYGGTAGVNPLDLLIGAAAFIATPKRAREYMDALFAKTVGADAASARQRLRFYVGSRLEAAARSFAELEESFIKASEKRLCSCVSTAVDIFDDAAARVCRGCPSAARCYDRDFEITYANMLELLRITEEGGLSRGGAPDGFAKKCARAREFTEEFLHVYELYRVKEIFKGEAVRSRDAAAAQYGDISRELKKIADDIKDGIGFRNDYEEEIITELDKKGITVFEISVIEISKKRMEVHLGLNRRCEAQIIEEAIFCVTGERTEFSREENGISVFSSRPRLYAETGICAVPIQISAVSGDVAEVFDADEYTACVILSDGMGSGSDARARSRELVRLLKGFLKAGFGAETAINMVNSSMCLCLDSESTAALDLLCVDRLSGMAELYKTGGAESFVIHGAKTETIFPASLPAGMIKEINAVPRVFRVQDGDVIILASDGVTQAGGALYCEWVKKIPPCSDASETARKIVEKALELSGGAAYDDMTVAAVFIRER